jgi:hypothetical protein
VLLSGGKACRWTQGTQGELYTRWQCCMLLLVEHSHRLPGQKCIHVYGLFPFDTEDQDRNARGGDRDTSPSLPTVVFPSGVCQPALNTCQVLHTWRGIQGSSLEAIVWGSLLMASLYVGTVMVVYLFIKQTVCVCSLWTDSAGDFPSG